MIRPLDQTIDQLLDAAATDKETYAATTVEGLLSVAAEIGASDLHLQPSQHGLVLKWRIDGVLHTAGTIPRERADNVLSRLKIVAGLLTYRSETPQEGRIDDSARGLEFRVSTFPTLYGEKAVVRLIAGRRDPYESLHELGFDAATESLLRQAAAATSGAILLIGPAGSGKTTTAYTLLREIVRATAGGRSIASLEDPIEAAIDGVAQSQINPAAGFDLLTALRSLVRQDPEVILVGEIRDAEVAKVAYQAAMTGQLVVTTFHASDSADALARLLDMGIPPYVLRGATRLLVAQRLLRRVCEACGAPEKEAAAGAAGHTAQEPSSTLLPSREALNQTTGPGHSPAGCDVCRGTGYHGRVPAVEAVDIEHAEIGQALLRSADATALRRLFASGGHRSLLEQARSLVERRITTEAELVRVFGLTAIAKPTDGD